LQTQLVFALSFALPQRMLKVFSLSVFFFERCLLKLPFLSVPRLSSLPLAFFPFLFAFATAPNWDIFPIMALLRIKFQVSFPSPVLHSGVFFSRLTGCLSCARFRVLAAFYIPRANESAFYLSSHFPPFLGFPSCIFLLFLTSVCSSVCSL